MPARMEREVFQIRFTKAEREVLRRRAKKEGVTEADHLRMCMMMDAIVCGDIQAMGELGDRIREKVVERVMGVAGRRAQVA